MTFYDARRARGRLRAGVRTALEAILVEPAFHFPLRGTARAGSEGRAEVRDLDIDLASRLSFFFWGAAARQDADQSRSEAGMLNDPAVLEAQTKRMLADPRRSAVNALSPRSGCGCRTSTRCIRTRCIPDFATSWRRRCGARRSCSSTASCARTTACSTCSPRTTRSSTRGWPSTTAFPASSASEFRRVDVPRDYRRGLLGQGSILTLTSHAESHVAGAARQVGDGSAAGSPPPPPPPDVPDLEKTRRRGRPMLTTRERMEEHRRIRRAALPPVHGSDRPGARQLRRDGRLAHRENGVADRHARQLYDGTPMDGPPSCSRRCSSAPTPFIRTFTQNLMAYALGRRVEYYDMPTVRAIIARRGEERQSDFGVHPWRREERRSGWEGREDTLTTTWSPTRNTRPGSTRPILAARIAPDGQ